MINKTLENNIETISLRDFLRNSARVTNQIALGKRFQVTKNKKPLFITEPAILEEKRIIPFEELLQGVTKTGDPDLSQKVDEIVYGA